MLISFSEISEVLKSNNIEITGALHIGAHECEEIPFYGQLGLSQESLVWIEAIQNKVVQAKARGIPNVYNAVVTDTDDSDVIFNISNNSQSSSVLEFGTHTHEHPGITFIEKVQQKSITIDTFFDRNGIDASKHNFWNFDIQGAELMALKGAKKSIEYAKAIYLEVNEKELYKDCGLLADIESFLAEYGFRRVLKHMTHHGWGDALYIR
jgi:hypothetical protein